MMKTWWHNVVCTLNAYRLHVPLWSIPSCPISYSTLVRFLGPDVISPASLSASFFCSERAFVALRLLSWVTRRLPAISWCFASRFWWNGMGARREHGNVARSKCALWNAWVLITKRSMGWCSIQSAKRPDSSRSCINGCLPEATHFAWGQSCCTLYRNSMAWIVLKWNPWPLRVKRKTYTWRNDC